MKRRTFIVSVLALFLSTSLTVADPSLPVTNERTDCVRRFVDRKGKLVEYEYLGYYGFIQLAVGGQYEWYFFASADDGPGIPLGLVAKGFQNPDATGKYTISAAANTNGDLPWAAHHYYYQLKIYNKGTEDLVFDSGQKYVEVHYPKD